MHFFFFFSVGSSSLGSSVLRRRRGAIGESGAGTEAPVPPPREQKNPNLIT